jgi:hypothetical protein
MARLKGEVGVITGGQRHRTRYSEAICGRESLPVYYRTASVRTG